MNLIDRYVILTITQVRVVLFFVAKTAIGLKLAYSHYVNPVAIFYRRREMEGQRKPLSEEERLEGMAWMEYETTKRAVNAMCKEFGRDFANNLIEQGLYEEGLTLMKSLAGESE